MSNLISAAPTLYEALSECEAMLTVLATAYGEDKHEGVKRCVNAGRAALAAARQQEKRQVATTPILLDALEAINRQASPQPDRTGVMAMSDLELITDIARSALATARQQEG